MAKPVRIKIRIIYKSGATMDATCEDFQITNGRWEWTGMEPRPVKLGVDDIAAVWQLDHL